MQKRILLLFIAIIYCCSACSQKNQITVAQQSFVRWYEKENELEIYIVVSNSAKKDVTFQASIVFLDTKLKESVGIEAEQLKTDDRNNHPPFRLKANKETVFHRKFKTKAMLTEEMLSGSVGIEIIDQQKSYITTIKYTEIQ